MATANQVNGGAVQEPPEKMAKRSSETKRKSAHRGSRESFARYFLKAGSDGKLELGEELPSEHAATVAAFKRDSGFLIVTEWNPKIESGRQGPVIRKEQASRKS